MRKFINLLLISSLMFLFSFTIEGVRWSITGKRTTWSMGYSGALLTNGKVVIEGVKWTAEYEVFDPSTGVWTAKTLSGLTDHYAGILLPNGKVLQTLTGSALYLYDPTSDSWGSSGTSFSAATKNNVTLLKNDKVLLIGTSVCYLYDYSTDGVASTGNVSDVNNGTETLLPTGEVLVIKNTFASTYNPTSGVWTTAPLPAKSRFCHTAILLPPPLSKVLVAGGTTAGTTCELFDPVTKTWGATGNLTYGPRVISESVLLPSGKVLMISSDPDNGGAASASLTCELYDPAAGTWALTDNLIPPISTFGAASHNSAFILQTGKVLLAGCGKGSASNPSAFSLIYDPSDGVFTARPSLTYARAAHTTTPLPIVHTSNCSTNVLIVGGENSSGAMKKCELYNYRRKTIEVTGDLNTERSNHTAVLMSSGLVLVTGGKNTSGTLKSCETYDVNTELWTNASNMTDSRFDHSATLLTNGTNVLVTGGENAGSYVSNCEIYNGTSWSSTASLTTPRARHSTVLLFDGRILAIGGQTTGGTATNSCEIWDGTNWSSAANLNTARYWHTSILLQSGKVLVMGGTGNGSTALASCEIYDPVANTWTQEANLNQARYQHNSTLLYSGLVLTTGGYDGTNYTTSAEIWDPAAEFDSTLNIHNWKITAQLPTARAYQSSVLVTDLQPYILVIGGKNTSYVGAIEEYDVGLSYDRNWQPTITSSPSVTHVTSPMTINGTLFRGVSEADGGNYCHITSNDHPIVSIVRIGGGNWQSNGGGDMLYTPNSSLWSETSTTINPPVGFADGYYRLWVIANGIPSKWYEGCATGTEEKSNPQSKIQNPQLEISPNPFTSTTVISYSGISYLRNNSNNNSTKGTVGKQANIKIYDISGKLLEEVKDNIIGENLKAGIYFVKIDGYKPIKVVKMSCIR
ncbi:MAG: kelch repeat-containing protein [bacterium]|nr:kelch repeat-containing protein [bacterium]